MGIHEDSAGVAIDLGCGPGIHAVALAGVGFSVIALDACSLLVEELRQRTHGLNVRGVRGDLRQFGKHCPEKVDLILCMGDTLTHLPSEDAVDELLHDIASALRPGGLFIATLRDYTAAAPSGTARFIPVCSDDRRIMTCFLEYGETTVTVSDMLHARSGEHWKFRVSRYPTIRLDPSRVIDRLEWCGLRVKRDAGARGMVRLVGTCA